MSTNGESSVEGSLNSLLFAAVHKGPYLTIQPLERAFKSQRILYLVDGIAKEERAENRLAFFDLQHVRNRWGSMENFFERWRVQAVIRSSSETVDEDNVEDRASVAAYRLGVPVFVVEDFPGNYWLRSDQRLDALFVEDDWQLKLHEQRGVEPQRIIIAGNPRYDGLAGVDRESRRKEAWKYLHLKESPVVLWVGQPDGNNSLQAFKRLLEHFDDCRVTFLFRAHPRDQAYKAGIYDEVLGGVSMKVLNVSSYPDPVDLYCASDLVITQFSSAAVEASFVGTPSLFLLFRDLAKKYLRSFKGYEILPWCRDDCSFFVEREEEINDVMKQALFDSSSRERVRTNFERHFGVRKNSAKIIGERIHAILGEAEDNQ